MKAVWSFWTKPYSRRLGSWWLTEDHHWLAWGLSFFTAQQHYPQTCLVTDDEGARILVDELQLPFAEVSTALNGLSDQNPGWWALGKVEAYRRQEESFVHIDPDVFLWKRLPPEVESADVFSQHAEPAVGCYRPEEIEQSIAGAGNGWLPKEWLWYRKQRATQEGQCCGVLGGNRIDFINHYAEMALQLVAHSGNRQCLHGLPGKGAHMILVEQYLLSACVEYHRRSRRSPYHGIQIRHVFPTVMDAFRAEQATRAGFTHLAGDAKRNEQIARALEKRVRLDLPRFYERCVDWVSSQLAPKNNLG